MRQLSLLQSAMDCYYKLRHLFYYKLRHGLLQIATGITKCDDYYKLRQYSLTIYCILFRKRQLLFDNFLRIRKNISLRSRRDRYLARAKFWQRSCEGVCRMGRTQGECQLCRQNQLRRVSKAVSQNTDLFVTYPRTREQFENNQNAHMKVVELANGIL